MIALTAKSWANAYADAPEKPASGQLWRREGRRPQIAALRKREGTSEEFARFLVSAFIKEGRMGRGILLWLLGVPIPIIILIALLYH